MSHLRLMLWNFEAMAEFSRTTIPKETTEAELENAPLRSMKQAIRKSYGCLRVAIRAAWVLSFLLAAVFAVAIIQVLAKLFAGKTRYHELSGLVISRTCDFLGPTFIKIGQSISYREDIFPQEFLSPFKRLCDQVRPESFRKAEQTIIDSLGVTKYESVFQEISHVPVGAGSVATVFSAKGSDGRMLAVKVIKRHAEENIRCDLTVASFFMKLVSFHPYFKTVPVAECTSFVFRSILDQVDLRIEHKRLAALANDHRVTRNIEIPRVWSDLVSKSVLVMEFVQFARPINHNDIGLSCYRDAADRLLRSIYAMIFETGLVHCDFHPGNILITPSCKTYLLDAGLMSELTPKERELFTDFFLGLAFGETDRIADSILRSSVVSTEGLDRVHFHEEIRGFVKRHSKKLAGEFSVARVVLDVFALQKKFGLNSGTNFVSCIWALAMFEGLVRHRVPDLDFQEISKDFLAVSIIRAIRA
ncbi:ABC1 kinase family protein [Ruegeria arenilitoris]|uniref:ABC1 kinase family protein n=1 Tax=Ruegeria arenilitoris TaxID=1173585 RepID=UPI00147F3876|nr:AarF/UbiB family protein [Ruegeria arenilitoris]